MVRGFANNPWDLRSIPGRVIPKTQKWYGIHLCFTFSIIMYTSRVKRSNPGKGVLPSSTSRCSSYWKCSVRVASDDGHQFYLIYIVHIFQCTFLRIFSLGPLMSFVVYKYGSISNHPYFLSYLYHILDTTNLEQPTSFSNMWMVFLNEVNGPFCSLNWQFFGRNYISYQLDIPKHPYSLHRTRSPLGPHLP